MAGARYWALLTGAPAWTEETGPTIQADAGALVAERKIFPATWQPTLQTMLVPNISIVAAAATPATPLTPTVWPAVP